MIHTAQRVESLQRKMELYEQLLMEIQDGLQAVKDEHSGLEQVRVPLLVECLPYSLCCVRLAGQRLRNNNL